MFREADISAMLVVTALRIGRGYSLPEMAPSPLPPLSHWVCIYQNAVSFYFLYIDRPRLNDPRASACPVNWGDCEKLWNVIHKMAGFSLLVIEHSISASSEASLEWGAVESRNYTTVSTMTGPDVCFIYCFIFILFHFNGHVSFILFNFFVRNTFLHWQMQDCLIAEE